MLEIERLANMLKEAGIPFRRRGEDLKPQMLNWFKCQIVCIIGSCLPCSKPYVLLLVESSF